MKYMADALKLAKEAFLEGEVPVGAVIVQDGKIISCSKNSVQKSKDCTCHAEINAIKSACEYLNSKFLDKCEMYVTVEPCAMCTGAISNAKIKRVYIGTPEPRTGCMGSAENLISGHALFHKPEVYFGFYEDESKKLIKSFFENKR